MGQLDLSLQTAVQVRRDGNTWRWECPHCGFYLDERADVEGQEEPTNGETAETIAADPACASCRAEFMGITVRELGRQATAATRAGRPWKPPAPPIGWRPLKK